MLERRLDNVVWRAGLASSRSQARQLVLHGHVRVNGKKVNIPSYLVNVGEEVAIKEKMHQNAMVLEARNVAQSQNAVPWLEQERSEEHTSELQSQSNLVCRLLLEKKNKLREVS